MSVAFRGAVKGARERSPAALLAALALAVACGRAPAGETRASSSAAQPPDWATVVAPILHRHCAGCHRPESVGPFPLLTYDDARRRARLVAEVVERGLMPPFLPERDYGRFRNARGLSPEERSAIAAWERAGAPSGDLALAPAPPVFHDQEFELGEPDLLVEMPEAFALPADGPDVYRNFLIPLPLAAGSHVRAIEIDPGNRRVVHHAALLADTSGAARSLEQRDRVPGYDEMVGGVAPGGHFVGWTPGRGAVELAPGMQWTVEEGTDLVLQLHLLPSGRPESVRARVGLWLTPEPPRERPTQLHLLATDLDIEAGVNPYLARDELVLPVAVRAYSIYPHAHFLGREIKVWAELPDGATEPLLWIRNWSFDWQEQYGYLDPVRLPAGSRLHLELAYDNSGDNPRNPSSPPRRVVWGPSSLDEMGDVWLAVVPERAEERAALERVLRRHESERYRRGYELRVAADPGDADAHGRLGIGYVHDGRWAQAVPHLELALAERPDAWDLNYNLGVALAVLGRPHDAIARYERALAADPRDARAHNAIAGTYLAAGALERAIDHYRRAVELRPGSADLHSNLGLALQQAGDGAAAERSYREALGADPEHVLAQSNYGGLLSELGRDDEAAAWFEAALRLEPDRVETRLNLARSLARSGRFAEAEAQLVRAAELRPGDADTHYLLGLILVQLERPDDAVAALERALELDPDHPLARQDLEALRGVAGRPSDGRAGPRPSNGSKTGFRKP